MRPRKTTRAAAEADGVHVHARCVDPVAHVLALHMVAGDNDRVVAVEQRALGVRPPILIDERADAQLPAMPRGVQRNARRAEHAIARPRDWKSKMLLTADARAQIPVHELDDAPPGCQALVDREMVHVVREAHVWRPGRDALQRAVDPFSGDAELIERVRLRRGKRRRLRVAMQNRHGVPARDKSGRDAIEIALHASRIAEAVVRDQNAHCRGHRAFGHHRGELAAETRRHRGARIMRCRRPNTD
jgi:hypothetical protein